MPARAGERAGRASGVRSGRAWRPRTNWCSDTARWSARESAESATRCPVQSKVWTRLTHRLSRSTRARGRLVRNRRINRRRRRTKQGNSRGDRDKRMGQ